MALSAWDRAKKDAQESYDTWFDSLVALRAAVEEAVDARFINYKHRMVSNREAAEHARIDVDKLVIEMVKEADPLYKWLKEQGRA